MLCDLRLLGRAGERLERRVEHEPLASPRATWEVIGPRRHHSLECATCVLRDVVSGGGELQDMSVNCIACFRDLMLTSDGDGARMYASLFTRVLYASSASYS